MSVLFWNALERDQHRVEDLGFNQYAFVTPDPDGYEWYVNGDHLGHSRSLEGAKEAVEAKLRETTGVQTFQPIGDRTFAWAAQ